MKEYVKVTVRGNKRNRSFWAVVETRGKNFTLYIPVDDEGDDKGYYKGDAVILPKELIGNTMIIKELPARMNLKYAELELC